MSILPEPKLRHMRSRGYVVLRNILPIDSLRQLNLEISQSALFRARMGKCFEAKDPYLRAFDRIMNCWTEFSHTEKIIFHSALASLSRELLQCSGVRLSHDQCLYKPPSADATPIHADQYHWPVSSEKTLTAWIPLQDTSVNMGAIQYFAGSHLLEEKERRQLSESPQRQVAEYFRDSAFPLEKHDFALGDVGFHYGWTFHTAAPNSTTNVRGVLTVVLMEDGIKLLEHPRDNVPEAMLTRWCPGCKLGDPLASPLNPKLD